jgi:competence protein ComEC
LEPRLPPETSGDLDASDGTTVNESSVVLLIDVVGPAGRIRMLDLADLETGRQQGLEQRLHDGGDTLDGPVDVVKVAHHGSARQADALYASCGARLGLISVGADNDYGHPAEKTLGMLARAGIRVARTDEGGDLVVERSRQGLRVTASG